MVGYKGERVITDSDDAESLSRGIYDTYQQRNLRYSQMAPLDLYTEKNTGTNLPAQVEVYAVPGDAYELLFIAKGGGSANKSFLFQETKALLNPESSLMSFLEEKIRSIGTSACPPYHLAIVIGGTSAEYTLKTVKLASCHALDDLPTSGQRALGRAFRDLELEEKVHKLCNEIGIGAQFGGKYFAHDVRVDAPAAPRRVLPGGSRRLLLGRPAGEGEDQRRGGLPRGARDQPGEVPARTSRPRSSRARRGPKIDLRRPMAEILAELSKHPGRHAALADGSDGRRPRHRPREAEGAPRRRRGPAPVHEGPHGLLRRSREDARGPRVGLLRSDDGRAAWTPTSTSSRARAAAW